LDPAALPDWSAGILRVPGGGGALAIDGATLRDAHGRECGRVERGIARVPFSTDASIAFYRAVGGAHFHERASTAYAMTTLDTPVYHGYLESLRPQDPDGLVADVGGGDGRNALPWLRWGYRRVVVVDPVLEALERFRVRVAEENPEWLDRLLLVEGDARALPLASGCAARVVAIEALAYLNEDYPRGLAQCARLLERDGRLLLADRDYEAGLLMRLYYFGGVTGMLEHAGGRDLWDGSRERMVRSRCFTEAELAALVEAAGLRILERKGISGLSLVLSDLRARGGILPGDEKFLPGVGRLLGDLGETGRFRRSHVLVAAPPSDLGTSA
jgi:SAM-dependent methyltransferase